MSDAIRIGSRRVSTVKVLLALLGLAVLAALFTPDVERGDDNLTTYSTSTGGARIVYELAQRMGWKASRREAPLDSAPSTPNTQVVIGIRGALGAHEVHALLDNVRRGGGLIFSVDAAPEIADSLGLRLRARARLLGSVGDSECRAPRSFSERQEETLPPTVNEMVWRRPAPGRVTALATLAATACAGRCDRVSSGKGARRGPQRRGRVREWRRTRLWLGCRRRRRALAGVRAWQRDDAVDRVRRIPPWFRRPRRQLHGDRDVSVAYVVGTFSRAGADRRVDSSSRGGSASHRPARPGARHAALAARARGCVGARIRGRRRDAHGDVAPRRRFAATRRTNGVGRGDRPRSGVSRRRRAADTIAGSASRDRAARSRSDRAAARAHGGG